MVLVGMKQYGRAGPGWLRPASKTAYDEWWASLADESDRQSQELHLAANPQRRKPRVRPCN